MMKKEYITPELEIVKAETQQMLAFSGNASNPVEGDAGGAAAPGLNDDDISNIFGW